MLAKHANHKSFLSPLFLLAFYLCCSKSLSPISPSWHTSRFILLLLLLLLISFPLSSSSFFTLISQSQPRSANDPLSATVPQGKKLWELQEHFRIFSPKTFFCFFFFPPRPVVARSYECFKPDSPKSVISLRFFHGINAIFTCGCARWWDLNICRINVSQEKKKTKQTKKQLQILASGRQIWPDDHMTNVAGY